MPKILQDILTTGKTKLREDYKFARDFLQDVSKDPAMHHLVLERGLQGIAGSSKMLVSEISYLMSLTEPNKRIKEYSLAKSYIQLNAEKQKIEFKKEYKTKFSRAWRKSLYLFCYVMFAFLAVSPLILAGHFGISFEYWTFALASIPGCFYLSGSCLLDEIKISTGELLIKEQKFNTTIFLLR